LGLASPIILSRLQELIPKNMKDIPDNNDNNNMIAIENHVKSDIYFPFNPEPTSIDLDKDI
jgi:hypothetical protein